MYHVGVSHGHLIASNHTIRAVFATVNQLRGALPAEAFGYWLTLYQSYVKNRFPLSNADSDPVSQDVFVHSAYSIYLEYPSPLVSSPQR